MDKQHEQLIFAQHFRWLIPVFILLNLAIGLACLIHPFWSQEYQDSFVFNEASRMIYENSSIPFKGLAVVSIADGSILSPITHGFYGGHLVLFPFLVSLVYDVLGYSIFNIFLFNTIISVSIL